MTIPEQAVEAAFLAYARAMNRIRPGEGATTHADCLMAALEAAQPLMGVQRPEDVARIIDPGAWPSKKVPTHEYKKLGARRAVAREKAAAVLALPHTGQRQKCIRCSNEVDIEGQDICGYCAAEELHEAHTGQPRNNQLCDQLMTIHDQLRTGIFGQREVWERSLREAVAALCAVPQAGCAKEEWQLVPKDDPTRDHANTLLPIEMVFAGQEALENCQGDLSNYVSGQTPDWDGGMIAVAIYRAMLAASPPPPVAESGWQEIKQRIAAGHWFKAFTSDEQVGAVKVGAFLDEIIAALPVSLHIAEEQSK